MSLELNKEDFYSLNNIDKFKYRFEIFDKDKIMLYIQENFRNFRCDNDTIIVFDEIFPEYMTWLNEHTTTYFYIQTFRFKDLYKNRNQKFILHLLSREDAVKFKLTFGGDE